MKLHTCMQTLHTFILAHTHTDSSVNDGFYFVLLQGNFVNCIRKSSHTMYNVIDPDDSLTQVMKS